MLIKNNKIIKKGKNEKEKDDPWRGRGSVQTRIVFASLGLLNSNDEEGTTSPKELISIRVFDLKPKSTTKNFASLCLPWGTPAKCLLENSTNNGTSQGKEKKINDKVHCKDGGGDENPRDGSANNFPVHHMAMG
jgi:hypothetical protein